MVRKRSSKARIWKEARTRMAMPSGRMGSRPRVPWPSASISSPIQRASSSPSQWPMSRTFSPWAMSVQSVLPSRCSFEAITPEAAARMCGVER